MRDSPSAGFLHSKILSWVPGLWTAPWTSSWCKLGCMHKVQKALQEDTWGRVTGGRHGPPLCPPEGSRTMQWGFLWLEKAAASHLVQSRCFPQLPTCPHGGVFSTMGGQAVPVRELRSYTMHLTFRQGLLCMLGKLLRAQIRPGLCENSALEPSIP